MQRQICFKVVCYSFIAGVQSLFDLDLSVSFQQASSGLHSLVDLFYVVNTANKYACLSLFTIT